MQHCMWFRILLCSMISGLIAEPSSTVVWQQYDGDLSVVVTRNPSDTDIKTIANGLDEHDTEKKIIPWMIKHMVCVAKDQRHVFGLVGLIRGQSFLIRHVGCSDDCAEFVQCLAQCENSLFVSGVRRIHCIMSQNSSRLQCFLDSGYAVVGKTMTFATADSTSPQYQDYVLCKTLDKVSSVATNEYVIKKIGRAHV